MVLEYEEPQEVEKARRRALIQERRPANPSQEYTWALTALGDRKGCKNGRKTLFLGKDMECLFSDNRANLIIYHLDKPLHY